MSDELVARIQREWLETKEGSGFEDLYSEEWETLMGYLWDRAYNAGYEMGYSWGTGGSDDW